MWVGWQVSDFKTPMPENDKLHAVVAQSQAIGSFLEWLESRGRVIAVWHQHNQNCDDEYGYRCCGYRDGEDLQPDLVPIAKRLAEYFDTDTAKLEAEKQKMLAEVQEANT